MINIIRLFTEHGVQFDPTINDGWVNVCCPFHRPKDVDFFLGFRLGGDYFHCWKCGGHSPEYVVATLLKITRTAATHLLRDYSDDTVVRAKLNKKEAKAISLTLPEEPLGKMERRYLKERNFNPEELQIKYQLCSGGISGDWKYRIIIPIFLHGKLVSWTSRDITDQQKLRYKTLAIEKSVIDPKTIFYNMDNSKGKTGVVVEGPFDVMRMGDDCVCGLGSSLEEAQLGMLRRRFERVFFLFDSEPDAQRKAKKYAEKLSVMGRVQVEVVDMETGDDPGNLTESEVKYIRKELGV